MISLFFAANSSRARANFRVSPNLGLFRCHFVNFQKKNLLAFRCGFRGFTVCFFRGCVIFRKTCAPPPRQGPPLESTNQRHFATPRTHAHIIKKSRSLWRQTNQNKRINHVIGELLQLPTLQIFVFGNFSTT